MSNPEYRHTGDTADRIVEECGEVLQAVIKGKRFGWNSFHPNTPDISNLQQLSMEIDDVYRAFKDLLTSITSAMHSDGEDGED